ncbi:MAG: bifunctional hydroxymethylpyrimidine kinase/phosphomethylpyrimidine kinase [Anaerolineae bacterium]|nr:bifunctional hydroxymethylpyrimidine kinase/phosphomethylpyrimidine kinase [Anaerolineae bacterium]MDW8100227.1 bifunctional hydroxymethylpyrimidine kinase/phosphomethylpyrimidine kinase [Anaerolineae bacterium]
MKLPRCLTIAGSDSGGGAGIQADLKTFAARGVYGMSALTAITAQNTVGVQGVFELPAEFVGQQIDSIMDDIGADAWKTGMLANAEIIHVVSDRARRYGIERLIVDPVMVAKGGDPLLRPEAQTALVQELIPLAYVVTPNHHEAQALTGLAIHTIEDMRQAAVAIHALGARHVVVKGGHLLKASDAVDVLYDGRQFIEFRAARVDTKNTHGTGCTFASAIAAELAKGRDIVDAIRIAKAYLTATLQAAAALQIGRGHGPLNHWLGQEVEGKATVHVTVLAHSIRS